MSTVDPAIAKAARAARRPGPVQVFLALALQFAGGLALGYGWASFATLGGDDAVTFEPPGLVLAAVIASIPLTVLGSIVWLGVVLKRREFGLLQGFGVVLFGAGLGMVASSRDHPSDLVLTLGFVAFGIAGVLLVLGFLAANGRRVARERAEVTMRTGTRVTGVVTDKGYTVFHDSDRILTSVTFRFTDLQGVDRWVQRTMVIHVSAPVVDGQETDVWFDAANPSDDAGIVVRLAHENPLR